MVKTGFDKVRYYLGLTDDLMTVKNIARISLLVAIAIVLKAYLSLETGIWRFTLYDIPLFVLGVFYGPMFAIMGGLATDFTYVMSRGWMYGFNIFTITTVVWALLPALFLFRRKYSRLRLIGVMFITAMIAFILNTIGLEDLFGPTQLIFLEGWIPGPLFPRVITAVLKFPLQVYFVHVLVTRLKSAYEDLILVLEK